MQPFISIIGGSGFYNLGEDFVEDSKSFVETPYGVTSAEIIRGSWQNQPVVFLARHGESHRIPPHQINYRANLYALKLQGVTHVIAVNAVGGISSEFKPKTIALPDQIIDYSWGREHTYSDADNAEIHHIDFTYPYSSSLRAMIVESGKQSNITIQASGVYGCTNGPRLETKAEIIKMSRDGCDMIGMTGMPEAALARELGIEYASIALVVNWCAGVNEPENSGQESADTEITMKKIMRILEQGLEPVKQLILSTLKRANQ
jgi:5'-deoxy-5'-methylthioadenosine phosphorylase